VLFLCASPALQAQALPAAGGSWFDSVLRAWHTLQAPDSSVDIDTPNAVDRPHALDSPDYGVGLYELYQSHFFSSLSELAVAESRDQLGVHADEAQLVRAGLYLSFGMHDLASTSFQKLMGRRASPALRDRAWLYLGKMRYDRGLLDEADDALTRVGGALSAPDQDEFQVLRGNLLMARGNYAQAAAILRPAQEDNEAATSRYARFNLAVALMRSGNPIHGQEVLDELGVEPVGTEDEMALRDRANLALGLDALRGKDSERARFVLERIRLTGPYAARALLAYGWASQAEGHSAAALAIWSKLSGYDPADPAVLEGLMAGPAVLAREGSLSLALNGYGKALAVLGEEEDRCDQAAREVASGDWIDRMVLASPDEETGWLRQVDTLPNSSWFGELLPLAADATFQEAFKNYRDLEFLREHTRRWREKLATVEATLQARDQTAMRQLDAMRHPGLAPAPAVQIDLLQGDLSAKKLATSGRLASMRARLDGLAGHIDTLRAEQRQYITQLAAAALQTQKDAYSRYAHQARFAVAQLYDAANRRDEEAKAPRRKPAEDPAKAKGAPDAR
jgi:hypothetical protein